MAHDQSLTLTIRLKSPLLITARQVGFVWESEPLIPGSVIRGAVAEVAKRQGEDLQALFGRPDAPRFGNAHPGVTLCVGVLPYTARTCKRHGGFKRDAQDDERHDAWDTLLSWLKDPKAPELRCPVIDCDQRAEPYGGMPYTVVGTRRAPRYAAPQVRLQRIGRTAVARERGAVADRLLYALEVITPQIERDELGINGRPLQAEATFHGTMWVVSAEAERWCEWLADVHHLGGARSRGLGRVEVTATVHQNGVAVALERQIQQTLWQLHDGTSRPATTHPPDMTLTDRILTFNREAYDLGVNDAFWYFTVDLESAMILGGVRGPRFRLEPGDLGLPAQVALVRGWARYGEAGGWSTAWGLPKPVAPALVAGSTFLFKAPRQDEALIQQILERCVFLERKGIGQRRDEGYGWVKICTPFHLKKEAAK